MVSSDAEESHISRGHREKLDCATSRSKREEEKAMKPAFKKWAVKKGRKMGKS